MADSSKPSEVKFLKSNPPGVWDLAKLEASVNATSQRAVTQWLAYLSLWAYLFFTTLSVTHRDLILLTPVKLPLIGVELGLREYFWSAPPLFCVFHLYLVRKITVLARDVAFYRTAIERFVPSVAAREPLYRRLDAFFLTRLLGYREQGWLLRWLDGGIAVATVVVMPLALMLAFQLYYLAYHDPDATDWHRGWLVADVLLLAVPLLWRVWRRSRGVNGVENNKRRLRVWCVAIGKILGLTLVFGGCAAFSLVVATFPDDRMDWALPVVDLSGKKRELSSFYYNLMKRVQSVVGMSGKKHGLSSLRDLDLQAPDFLNDAKGEEHPLSSWRVLAPRDTDFVNDEKLDKVQWTIDLRGRDLRGANLSGADLRKARMTGVNLQGADLSQSDLKEADLSDSFMDEVNMNGCKCHGVMMKGAKLRGADLSNSYFIGANLNNIHLSGSYMRDSHFQFSDIEKSHLEGVVSTRSQFQWANMKETKFDGSDLTDSIFERANLIDSSFIGADLKNIRIWGAEFRDYTDKFKYFYFRTYFKLLMEHRELAAMKMVDDTLENDVKQFGVEEKNRLEEINQEIKLRKHDGWSEIFDLSENHNSIVYSRNNSENHDNKWINLIPSLSIKEKKEYQVKNAQKNVKNNDKNLKKNIKT